MDHREYSVGMPALSPAPGNAGEFQGESKGFTLVEVLITILILSLIAGAAYLALNLSGSKGKALYLAMSSMSRSAQAFNASLGTYPTVYAAMFDPAYGKSANYNLEQVNLSATWDGPYAKARRIGPSGNLHLNNIASGVTLVFQSLSSGNAGSAANGLAAQYAVVALNVPPSIAKSAVNYCNGGKLSAGSSGECVLVQGSGNTDLVYYDFSQTQAANGTWNQQSVQSAVMDGGNAINLTNVGDSIALSLPGGIHNNNNLVPDYQSSLSYNPSSGAFNGCLNISGSAMVGYVCGSNSGICGNGGTITANSTGATCGPGGSSGISYTNSNGQTVYLPASDGNATGGPINYSGGTFQGQPIQVNWVSSSGQLMHETFAPSGSCVVESVNGAQTGSFCP